MIPAIFRIVFNMSITAAVTFFFILFLRMFLRGCPRMFYCLLWSVFFFRLLCPVSFSAEWSVFHPIPSVSTKNFRLCYASDMPRAENDTDSRIDNTDAPKTPENKSIRDFLHTAFPYLWIGVAVGLFLWEIAALIVLGWKLRNSTCVGNHIFCTPKIKTAFVYGMPEPDIYLPDACGGEMLDFVLEHEEAHIARRDYVIKYICFLCLCLHWFNPFVWIAYRMCAADMEMACDESVLWLRGAGCKKQYAHALLSLTAIQSGMRILPNAFGVGDIKKRVINILRYKKPRMTLLVRGFVLCIAALLLLAANPHEPGKMKAAYGTDEPAESRVCPTKLCENYREEWIPPDMPAEISDEISGRIFALDQKLENVLVHSYGNELILMSGEGYSDEDEFRGIYGLQGIDAYCEEVRYVARQIDKPSFYTFADAIEQDFVYAYTYADETYLWEAHKGIHDMARYVFGYESVSDAFPIIKEEIYYGTFD